MIHCFLLFYNLIIFFCVSDYDKLFQHLNSLQGNLDTRCLFIRDIVREAGRFKKKVLIGLLEQFEQSMVKLELRKQRTSSTNQNPPSR